MHLTAILRSITQAIFIFSILITSVQAQQWKQYNKGNSNLLSDDVKSLARDVNGGLYAGTLGGLAAFKNGTWQQLNVGNIGNTSILRVWISKDSLWWAQNLTV